MVLLWQTGDGQVSGAPETDPIARPTAGLAASPKFTTACAAVPKGSVSVASAWHLK